jgi:hypothetical protein
MKTVTVQSILLNAASRAGLDGSSIDNLSSTTKAIMLSNLDIHLRAAWEFFDWPDLTVIEQRTVTTGGLNAAAQILPVASAIEQQLKKEAVEK